MTGATRLCKILLYSCETPKNVFAFYSYRDYKVRQVGGLQSATRAVYKVLWMLDYKSVIKWIGLESRKCDDIINYGATNLITILPCNRLSLFKFYHTKHILFTSNHFVRFQNNFSFVSMCCFLLCSSWTRIFQSI